MSGPNTSTRPASMRTPLGRVRNLGSSHSGTSDFWRQRLTAVATALLIGPVIVIVLMLIGRNQAGALRLGTHLGGCVREGRVDAAEKIGYHLGFLCPQPPHSHLAPVVHGFIEILVVKPHIRVVDGPFIDPGNLQLKIDGIDRPDQGDPVAYFQSVACGGVLANDAGVPCTLPLFELIGRNRGLAEEL